MTAQESTQREILATYSVWKSYSGLLILFGFGAALLYGLYVYFADPPEQSDLSGRFFLFTGTAIYIGALPLFYRIFRQVLFDRRRVIWIRNGDLIYLDPKYFSMHCIDIAAMTMAFDDRNREGILLTQKDGSTKLLFTGGLSIDGDEVLTKLKHICFAHSAPVDQRSASSLKPT